MTRPLSDQAWKMLHYWFNADLVKERQADPRLIIVTIEAILQVLTQIQLTNHSDSIEKGIKAGQDCDRQQLLFLIDELKQAIPSSSHE